MPTSSSSYSQLRYLQETTYGVPPSGAPINLRMTGESLEYNITSVTSKEIRSDRQISDLIQTAFSVQGGFNYELSSGEFDPFLQGMLQGTWAGIGTNGVSTGTFDGVISTAGGNDILTAGVAPTGADAFTNLVKGQWLRLKGSTIGNQNTIVAQVSLTTAPTATVITFQGTPYSTGAATGDGGAAMKISASRLANGSTVRSFTIEKDFTDINQRIGFSGLIPGKMSMNFASGAIVGGTFDFLGSTSTRNSGSASIFSGATFDGSHQISNATASTTNDVMNAITGVNGVLENGVPLAGTFIKALKFTADNKLRGQTAIGFKGNAAVVAGTLEVKGDVEVYFADGAMYDKFIANTASSLQWRVTDSFGQGYVITFPKVKYGGGKVAAGAMDQDVMLTLPFTAILDGNAASPTYNKTFVIDRV